jgi:hypothetical protein
VNEHVAMPDVLIGEVQSVVEFEMKTTEPPSVAGPVTVAVSNVGWFWVAGFGLAVSATLVDACATFSVTGEAAAELNPLVLV